MNVMIVVRDMETKSAPVSFNKHFINLKQVTITNGQEEKLVNIKSIQHIEARKNGIILFEFY